MKIYRQGDVIIAEVESLKFSEDERVKSKGLHSITLALGEATGHSHVLEADTIVVGRPWSNPNEIAILQVGFDMMVRPSHVISIPFGGTVVHQEHGAIVLDPGNYAVVQQREYLPRRRFMSVRD